jgi:hypothetical protein
MVHVIALQNKRVIYGSVVRSLERLAQETATSTLGCGRDCGKSVGSTQAP